RHASNAPASLSLKVSRFVSPSVPPTGADKGRVQSECPHRLAVPFIVTNRGEKRSRAGRALVVRPLAAACGTVGWRPSEKTFASRVNRSGSWRVSREDLLSVGAGVAFESESVCCCALRVRTAPPRLIAPETSPQSIAVRLPVRLVVFAGVRPFLIR